MSHRKAFPHTGEDYSGFNAAKAYLEKRGFSVGELGTRETHIAVMHGTHTLGPYSKLDAETLNDLHGHIWAKGNDFRGRDVEIWLRPSVPGIVRSAFYELEDPSVLFDERYFIVDDGVDAKAQAEIEGGP